MNFILNKLLTYLLLRSWKNHMYLSHNIKGCIFCHMTPNEQNVFWENQKRLSINLRKTGK